MSVKHLGISLAVVAAAAVAVVAQTIGQPEEFTAVAIQNNNLPDSLGYDLRYAHQEPGEDGGRRIVIATDRPISFWEARNQPRSIDYPFTVIQIEIDKNGEGKSTLSFATRVMPRGNLIVLENFATSPIMLRDVRSKAVSR